MGKAIGGQDERWPGAFGERGEFGGRRLCRQWDVD